MTIADKLELLEQTKEAQRVKLGLPESLPFSDYKYFMKPEFNAEYLFRNGEQGIWLDPSDLSTMFQDVDGTEPVTKDGGPVALIKDKSGNNNHATQDTATARPIYRTDGELHWLEFDGVDDELVVNGLPWKEDRFFIATATRRLPGRYGLSWFYKDSWSLLEDYGSIARPTDRRVYQRHPSSRDIFRSLYTAYPESLENDMYASLNSKAEALYIKARSNEGFEHEANTSTLTTARSYIDVSVSLGQYLQGSYSNMRVYAYMYRSEPLSSEQESIVEGVMMNKAGLLL